MILKIKFRKELDYINIENIKEILEDNLDVDIISIDRDDELNHTRCSCNKCLRRFRL